MRLLKIVYLLLVMGLPVLSTAQSTKTSSETMSEIFSGKTHPLSYKLKDLTREWASMRVGQSATKTDYLQMLSAVFAGGSTFVTKGEVVAVGDTQYLITYALPAKRIDMAALMNTPRTDPDAFKPIKLTPDSLLTLTLVNVGSMSNLSEIHPFDMDEELRRNEEEIHPPKDEKKAKVTSLSNLKQLGLAAMMYCQDYDEVMPPMKSPEKLRSVLMPYLKNNDLFFVPDTDKKQTYVANTSLSYHSLAEIASPAETILMYEPSTSSDGTRAAVFADGHAKILPEADFQRLLKQSQMKILTSAPPPKPAPKPKPPRKKAHTAPKGGKKP